MDAPVWVVLLLKITAILLAAWLAHLALARANPRWRVFLWRVTAVGLIALPAVAWLFRRWKSTCNSRRRPRKRQPSTQRPIVPAPLAESGLRAMESICEHCSDDSRSQRKRPVNDGAAEAGMSGIRTMPETRTSPETMPSPQPSTQRERGPAQQPHRSTLTDAALGRLAWRASRSWPSACVSGITGFGGWSAAPNGRAAMGSAECAARGRGHRLPDAASRCSNPRTVESPFLCGLRRPLLLLPARMCEASYRKDLPGILAHELTHVRSHDVLWNVGLAIDFDRALVPSAGLADAQGPSGGLRVGLRRGFGELRRRRDRLLPDAGPGRRRCLCVASGGRNRHGPNLRDQSPAQRARRKGFFICRCVAGAFWALAVPHCWRFP